MKDRLRRILLDSTTWTILVSALFAFLVLIYIGLGQGWVVRY